MGYLSPCQSQVLTPCYEVDFLIHQLPVQPSGVAKHNKAPLEVGRVEVVQFAVQFLSVDYY